MVITLFTLSLSALKTQPTIMLSPFLTVILGVSLCVLSVAGGAPLHGRHVFTTRNYRGGSTAAKIDLNNVKEIGSSKEDTDTDANLTAMELKDLHYVKTLTTKSVEQLEEEGWKTVVAPSDATTYSVYQRPDKHNASKAQFLVIALLKNASPRAALFANVNSGQRKRWDVGIKEIYSLPVIQAGEESILRSQRNEDHTFRAACHTGFDEVLYYRSKCPWPMKDRDYVMNRRCRVFEDRGAAMVTSHTTSDSRVAKPSSGVNRIDGYKSITAFISASSNTNDKDTKLLDNEGVFYVSLSTDDQVTASPSALRILNAVAGRMISEYMNKMNAVIEDVHSINSQR